MAIVLLQSFAPVHGASRQKAPRRLRISCDATTRKNNIKLPEVIMPNRFFVGGNWKANGSKASIAELVQGLNQGQGSLPGNLEAVVAPPFVYISLVADSLNPRYAISAQNVRDGGNGAFTGETTGDMLQDIGISWAIVGHSERRRYYGETDKIVGEKVVYALNHSIKVIACIGETLEQREAGKTLEVCKTQLQAIDDAITKAKDLKEDHWFMGWDHIVIAYEPVWAIGTGKVATPEQAQEVHAGIRQWLVDHVGTEAKGTRILYGGSVSAKSAPELAVKPDIDGFLVGNASLKAQDFIDICKSGAIKANVTN